MIIGCAQWAVTRGRFDVQYATNTLARYAAAPRQGHLDRALRMMGYLKYYSRATIFMDPGEPNFEGIKFVRHDKWVDMYPDTEEYKSEVPPEAKNKTLLKLTVLADATNGSCYITRRSVTGYMGMIGRAIVKTYSKRQNTVETSTYGSELVAMRIAMEALLELRFK